MIMIQLTGGLGNQMFQYAAGRALASRHSTDLKLDISWYSEATKGTERIFGLDRFSITAEIAMPDEIYRFAQPKLGMLGLIQSLRARLGLSQNQRVREQEWISVFRFASTRRNYQLTGYWQSEEYFKESRATLLKEFELKTTPSHQSHAIAQHIRDSQSVSLHVRRGDYVSNPKYTHKYGVLPLQYYSNAVRYITDCIENPLFFVFSDDPAWVFEHLEIPFPMHIVDHNGSENPHEDIWLMSKCNHHIIANSSFSWWGAWLGQHPNKIVCSPARWYAGREVQPENLIPKEWIQL